MKPKDTHCSGVHFKPVRLPVVVLAFTCTGRGLNQKCESINVVSLASDTGTADREYIPSLNQFCFVLSHRTALVLKLAAWRLKDNKAVAAKDFNAAQPKAC